MAQPLDVRSIATTDFDRWAPLWEGYNTFYQRTLPIEITRMTWSRFFDAYEPVHAMVAERDGQLLGLVHYIFHRSTITIGPVCYLQDLFTVAAERGRGIGRALIAAVYERARAAGSTRVYWHTHETNLTAKQLYDQVAQLSGSVQYRKEL